MISFDDEFIDGGVFYTKILSDKGTYLYRMDIISSSLPTLVSYKVFTISKGQTVDKVPKGLVYSNFGLAMEEVERVTDKEILGEGKFFTTDQVVQMEQAQRDALYEEKYGKQDA